MYIYVLQPNKHGCVHSAQRMYKLQRESSVTQVRGEGHQARTRAAPKVDLSHMRLFDRFRKMIMRLVLSLPSRRQSAPHQRTGERFDPPKTSCSSYHYSPNSHYTEAIADCIEFFNKSSQGTVWGFGLSSVNHRYSTFNFLIFFLFFVLDLPIWAVGFIWLECLFSFLNVC